MIVAGIDPGKQGAIVLLDSERPVAHFMTLPYSDDGFLLSQQVHKWMKLWGYPDLVVLEKIKPGGAKSFPSAMFQLGVSYGQVLQFLHIAKVPLRLPYPQQWQKVMHEGIPAKLSSKERSAAAYRMLFPHGPISKGPKGGKINENVVDALLIATYGVLKFGGGKIHPWRLDP